MAVPVKSSSASSGQSVKHPCCGSKQQRHKKGCTEAEDGSLPPDREEEAEPVHVPAKLQKPDRTMKVHCVDCGWKGAVSQDADLLDTKCPDCRTGLLVQ